MEIPLFSVGMARFELATSRPPDERSNRAEPHPVITIIKGHKFTKIL